MVRAVIYKRISTGQQAEQTGLIRQEKVCRQYAEENGLTVIESITDVWSGTTLDRPGLWRLRRLVQGGFVDTILIEQWERWSRGAPHVALLSRWIKRQGVSFEVCCPVEQGFDMGLRDLLRIHATNRR